MRSTTFIWCTVVLYMVLSGRVCHGALDDGEKGALGELLSTFPNLASIATSEFVVDGKIDYGRSWTNDFGTYCLNGDGYEYYGLYCSNGHIGGIVLTQAWESGLSHNFSKIAGLFYLKNVTVTLSELSITMESLVFNLTAMLPIERLITASNPLFLAGSFGHPSSLTYLNARLQYISDFTTFVNLRFLEVSILYAPGTVKCPPSLETLRVSYPNFVLSDLIPLVANLTKLKSVKVGLVPNLSPNRTILSESIETLDINVVSSGSDILVVNSSTLKTAVFTIMDTQLVLNTPNLQSLTITDVNNIPLGFNELHQLEELSLSTINIPGPSFPNLGFAYNLATLSLDRWTLPPSELSIVLCNLVKNNPKLSSLELTNIMNSIQGTVFELPTCLSNASQLISLQLTGGIVQDDVDPYSAASVLTALPPNIEYLNILNALDNDTDIYNLTQFGKLKELHLQDNRFVGEMKNDFLSFFLNLEKLHIESTFVNGTVPSIGWANMRYIELHCPINQWTGVHPAPYLNHVVIQSAALESIPNDYYLENLHQLEYFDVGTRAQAAIPTPSFWTRLPNLYKLSITNAAFLGPITSPIAAPRLRTLALGSSICGPLPDLDVPMTLDSLSFSTNKFTGTIPQSWATNLSIRTQIVLSSNRLSGTIPSNFLNKKMPLFNYMAFQDNYFTGPVWDLSQNYPTSMLVMGFNNFNICESFSLPPAKVISVCSFDSLPTCPGNTSECYTSWSSSCSAFHCYEQPYPRFLPSAEPCIAPPSEYPPDLLVTANPVVVPIPLPVPTTSEYPPDLLITANPVVVPIPLPVPTTSDQCPPPGPPGFSCINGQWSSNGSVSIPSITLPRNGGVIIVNGNLSVNGSLTFDGIGASLVVEGCVENVPTEVIVIIKGDEKLKPTSLLSQQGSECNNDLGAIPVNLVQDRTSCKQVKTSTKDSTPSSLLVFFEIDSHKCNTKWIVLGSVLGGIVVLGAVGLAILYHLSPRFRAFVRTCNPKKSA